MKKVFKGTRKDILEEVEAWMESELNEYDFVDVILEIIK